jgi:hypothetical protein
MKKLQKPKLGTDTEAELKEKILSKVGDKVHFGYPGNEQDKDGRLKDRVIIDSINEAGKVSYYDVVDLIEFKGEPEPLWLRIGYYRTPNNNLIWGSQTTITEPLSVWKKIIVQAAKEKDWFKQLLIDALKEI